MFTKRHFLVGLIICLAVWSSIIALPKTRTILYSQFNATLGPNTSAELLGSHPSEPIKEILYSLIKKYPDDVKVQMFAVEVSLTDPREKIQKYDELLLRFPHDVSLIQTRLRNTTVMEFGLSKERIQLSRNKALLLTPQELLQTLEVADQGETIEPKNSFYSWMKAMCWFGLGETDKALVALEQGAQKTFYYDGTLQGLRDQIYAQNLVFPVLIEDKWLMTMKPLHPHFYQIKKVAEIALELGHKAQKEEKVQRALDIYSAQIDLSNQIFNGSKAVFGQLIAKRILQQVWATPFRGEIKHSKESIDSSISNQAQSFAGYARLHGRTDLGNTVVSIAKDITLHDITIQRFYGGLTNISAHALTPVMISTLLSKILIRVLSICMLFGVVFIPLEYLFSAGIVSHARKRTILIKLSDNFLLAFLSLASAVASVGFIFYRSDNLFDLALSAALFDSSLFVLKFLNKWIPWIAPLVVSACCFIVILWKARKYRPENVPEEASLYIKIINTLLLWSLLVVFQLLWVVTLLLITRRTANFLGIDYIVYIAFLVPPALCLFVYYLRQGKRRGGVMLLTCFYWRNYARLLWQTMLALVVACTVLYGLNMVISLPSRHRADRYLDKFFLSGETEAARWWQDLDAGSR